MNHDDAFQRQLQTWLHQDVEGRVPDHLDAVLAHTGALPQRQPWFPKLYVDRRLARRLTLLAATALLASAMVGLALFGGGSRGLLDSSPSPSEPSSQPSDTPQSIDAIPGNFTPTGSMHQDREAPSATLLGDGRVLVVGGYGNGSGTSETYDPASGTFTPSGPLVHRRYGHSAILLADGRVLVVGGMDPEANSEAGTAVAVPELELWNPETNQFTLAGRLIEGRTGARVTLRPDGWVHVSSGAVWDGSDSELVDRTELWDPVTYEVTQGPPVAALPADPIASTPLPDGRTLLLTTSWARIWDPRTQQSTRSGRLVTPRQFGASATVLPDGRVLVVGGWPGEGQPGAGPAGVREAEIWDPVTGEFGTTSPTVIGRRQHTAVLLADGRVLVVGNGLTAGAMTSAEIFGLGEQE
jgi:hypothetical protein